MKVTTNMMDYLVWRGDLDFTQSKYCPVDSLIFAAFSYNALDNPDAESTTGIKLRELAPELKIWEMTGDKLFTQWRSLLEEMSISHRFSDVVVHNFVNVLDNEAGVQFSAVACDLPDGSVQVAFRGTDNTLAGWREDCALSFECPVPAQKMAAEYLTNIVNYCRMYCKKGVHVCGHSKGGNLAAYAASMLCPDDQSLLLSVYSFDGPGFTEEILASEGYTRLQPVFHSVIPQSSVVGMLLDYHPNYQVVYSFNSGLLQHDAFSWAVVGADFVKMAVTDDSSRLMDSTLHKWLEDLTPENRRQFTDSLFSLLSQTSATTTTELEANIFRTTGAIMKASIEMDPESKKMLVKTLRDLVVIGAETAFKLIGDK